VESTTRHAFITRRLSRRERSPSVKGFLPRYGRVAAFASSRKESTMGFFSKILEKLGFGAETVQAATAQPTAAAPVAPPAPAAATPVAAPPPPPIPLVDVVAQLEKRAAANPQKLNWKTSIVDLLKLLDIDSSLAAREELAIELNCPTELMGDSAKMNMWLHKNVLALIAANGGNIPKGLLD
jgi:hypothetical protein